jgi:hypothetical protein
MAVRKGRARPWRGFWNVFGFQPIILHEHANQGRTVIEKVEDHSDVGNQNQGISTSAPLSC